MENEAGWTVKRTTPPNERDMTFTYPPRRARQRPPGCIRALTMIPRACCRNHLVDKARVGFLSAQEVSAILRTACMVVPSIMQKSLNQHRELGTTATSVPAGREGAKRTGKGVGSGIAGLAASAPYVLPAPTWSLSDLDVATGDEEAVDSARAVLSPEEVKSYPTQLCSSKSKKSKQPIQQGARFQSCCYNSFLHLSNLMCQQGDFPTQ